MKFEQVVKSVLVWEKSLEVVPQNMFSIFQSPSFYSNLPSPPFIRYYRVHEMLM